MSAPKAKTKMTRSHWPKANRPNTKAKDLQRSQTTTVMTRFGVASIKKYSTSYMSRETAAMPAIDEHVGIKDHPVDAVVTPDEFADVDVSRRSLDIRQPARLFDGEHTQFDEIALDAKTKLFDKAQHDGHVPIIQIVSFSKAYLQENNILSKDMPESSKNCSSYLDDAKLRQIVQLSVSDMAEQAGFSKLEYLAAIHGNTEHPHVHLAMIETDDLATGRLAVREKEDTHVGKSPAAKQYDKQHHTDSTIERGMMRQSELDYFRQSLTDNVDALSGLSAVRMKEYQQNMSASISNNMLLNQKSNLSFAKDFIKLYDMLPDKLEPDTFVTTGLDMKVDDLSRKLLDGNDYGQHDYMHVAYQSAKLQVADKIIMQHVDPHKIAPDVISEYQALGLDINDYASGIVTPGQLSKRMTVSEDDLEKYEERYKKFIDNKTPNNMYGLVLNDTATDEIKDLTAESSDMLVSQTNRVLFNMLHDAKTYHTSSDDVKLSLATTLQDFAKTETLSPFDQELASRSEAAPSLLSKIEAFTQDDFDYDEFDKFGDDIKIAKRFLKDTYKESVKDITNMMMLNDSQELSVLNRQFLLKNNQELVNETLGSGDISKSGSLLYAALHQEIKDTRQIKRFTDMDVSDREALVGAYQTTTVEKMTTITTYSQLLKTNTSFMESQEKQLVRQSLISTLDDMREGYGNRLEYVNEIAAIPKMNDDAAKERLTSVALSQAIWREGMDNGLNAKQIQQNIKEANSLSDKDKLSTIMTYRLKELNNDIALSKDKAVELIDTLQPKNVTVSELINHEIEKQAMPHLPNKVTFDEADRFKYVAVSDRILVGDQQVTLHSATNADLDEDLLDVKKGIFEDKLASINHAGIDKYTILSATDADVVDHHIATVYADDLSLSSYVEQQLIANVDDKTISDELDLIRQDVVSDVAEVKKPMLTHDTPIEIIEPKIRHDVLSPKIKHNTEKEIER